MKKIKKVVAAVKKVGTLNLDRKWQKEDEKESQEQYVPDINVGNKNEEENL